MNLTTENTAIVLDSTSDYPEAPARFPNMRFVPLYVRFGDDTFRDYLELGPAEFYEKLRVSPVTPATAQPTPEDFVSAYEELAGYERIFSLHVSSKVSGTYQSAVLAADAVGSEKVQVVDTLTASLAIAMLAHAIQRRLARGTTDEEISEASMMGAVTMMGSTFINAQQIDYERFHRETRDIIAYLKKQHA